MSLSTERYISVFLDSTGEAQGTVCILVSSCDLETWGAPSLLRLSQLLLPFQGLVAGGGGVLSCYSLKDLGPDMQKAWKRLLTTLFFFFLSLG